MGSDIVVACVASRSSKGSFESHAGRHLLVKKMTATYIINFLTEVELQSNQKCIMSTADKPL